MENTLVNRVAESGIITFNLEDYYPSQEIIVFDIKDYLFHGLILKEKDFRQDLKGHDWSQYDGKIVLVQCNADAIIPVWAYMLISLNLTGHAYDIYESSKEEYLVSYYHRIIDQMNPDKFKDQRIVIKGCSNRPVPAAAYAKITSKLKPVALSIMFGEPCSTVPVYKKPRLDSGVTFP